MDTIHERVRVLVDMGRYDLAIPLLREALAATPDDAYLSGYLAFCHCERLEYALALPEAQRAVRLAPNDAYGHYILSRARGGSGQTTSALAAAREALRLNPNHAEYLAQLAGVQLDNNDMASVLEASERGLAIDPEHVRCLNLRALALAQLGRIDEARSSVQASLTRDPAVPFTHAVHGWICLTARQPPAAFEHFREALRLQPGWEYARLGLIEAMKLRNRVYAWLLRFAYSLGQQGPKTILLMVVLVFLGLPLLGHVAFRHPQWSVWIWPVFLALAALAAVTFTASPLFNTILRLDRFGKAVLSRDEVVASNWLGSSAVAALACVVLWLCFRYEVLLWLAIWFMFLMIPLACVFRTRAGSPRARVRDCATLTALGGLLFVVLAVNDSPHSSWALTAFIWGSLLCIVVVPSPNVATRKPPRRGRPKMSRREATRRKVYELVSILRSMTRRK